MLNGRGSRCSSGWDPRCSCRGRGVIRQGMPPDGCAHDAGCMQAGAHARCGCADGGVSEARLGGICGEAGGPPGCPGAFPFIIQHTGTVDGGNCRSVRRSGIDVRHKCCAECSIDNPMYSDGGLWPLKLNRHNIITVFISCLSGRTYFSVALHIDVWAHPVI